MVIPLPPLLLDKDVQVALLTFFFFFLLYIINEKLHYKLGWRRGIGAFLVSVFFANIVISNISIFPLFPITPYNLATITYILAAFLLFLIKPKKLIRKTNNE